MAEGLEKKILTTSRKYCKHIGKTEKLQKYSLKKPSIATTT